MTEQRIVFRRIGYAAAGDGNDCGPCGGAGHSNGEVCEDCLGRGRSALSARRNRQIVGTWPGGITQTATFEHFDEWRDDRFCEVFRLAEDVIDCGPEETAELTAGSWWDGCISVEWVGGTPDPGIDKIWLVVEDEEPDQ